MELSNFQTQLDSINASLVTLATNLSNLNSEVSTLNGEITGTLKSEDAAIVLSGLTDVATKLAAMVNPGTPA